MQGSTLRPLLAGLVSALALAMAATPAAGATKFERIAGFDEPSTPNDLDQVGIRKVGPKKAPNVLILNPGTSASAAYFRPLMSFVVSRLDGW